MDRLKIGISACFMHRDPTRAIFKGKTLLYVEESLAHWTMRLGAQAFMIQSVAPGSLVKLAEYAETLDGLVLHGGADVAPESYGETPLKPEWSGDRVRDLYEIELLHAFKNTDKPVLGVCRGAQLINVALGGSLYQDIAVQVPHAGEHQQSEKKTEGGHRVAIADGTRLRAIVGRSSLEVHTTHHQAVKQLGKGLISDAIADDGLIEGIEATHHRFVIGVQWHPEVLAPRRQAHRRIFDAFVTACRS